MIFNPLYQIKICDDFFNQQYICLGKQLIEIINFLATVLPPHIWFGADLDASPNTHLKNFSTFSLKEIGGDQQIIELAISTDQFLSGVFVAVKNPMVLTEQSIEAATEDEEYRSLVLEEVLIEIRAFDVSFFEIYSDSRPLAEKLSSHFKTPMNEKGKPSISSIKSPGPLKCSNREDH